MARQSRGKSAKAVFADKASTSRMDADGDVVKDPSARHGGDQHGKHALVSRGARIRRGDVVSADQIRDPASSTIRRPMITVSVRRAVLTAGSRNAFTPLLTASTPVMAVQPLAKALSSSQTLTAAVAGGICGGATTGTGWPPLGNRLDEANDHRHRAESQEQVGREHEYDARLRARLAG